jgi:molybdopterin converting factor small subunit
VYKRQVGELLDELNEKYPAMKLVPCQVSVNQKLAERVSVLRRGDEIAILPPFSGG